MQGLAPPSNSDRLLGQQEVPPCRRLHCRAAVQAAPEPAAVQPSNPEGRFYHFVPVSAHEGSPEALHAVPMEHPIH